MALRTLTEADYRALARWRYALRRFLRFSEKAARTWLPALSALYALDGAIGVITHLRGVQKRPGGLSGP